jgi:hypothetical protein
MRPQVEVPAGGPRTASEPRGFLPGPRPQKAIPPIAKGGETQPIDADVVRRRRQRRTERALAGWLATRLRARAHER